MTFELIFKDEGFLAVLKDGKTKSTSEIAKEMKCSHNKAKEVLKKLTETGEVNEVREKSGGRCGFTYKWMITEEGIKELEKKLAENKSE